VLKYIVTPKDKLRRWEVDKPGSGSFAKPGFGISDTETSNPTTTISAQMVSEASDFV
jgi:hypothetical protein